MSEDVVNPEFEERVRTLDALKAECLADEDLRSHIQEWVNDQCRRARLNLETLYRKGFSVGEDFSKNREYWLESIEYRQLQSRLEAYVEAMKYFEDTGRLLV
tara:strand:- start:149 stop:454 length:306 start_codon:yes stop_codon:yes gene_type:complete